ncbi:MAG: Unknown protein [uncultured Sulfurovum sp.]|uniref:Cell division protein FtsK n=1 Tax=uncultured Sulfurovum sp. TaxID=269237 RepID=A0A6S6S754_9BACT|nr:MAG: Unknown protein [uncultured Sulfurovum sp.]
MAQNKENYTFPWGFHLGDLVAKDSGRMPLYTPSNDGGFCLLYDKVSEKQVDTMLESLCLELLSSMPHESLKVNLFDFGRKKFYNLSPLQYMHLYQISYNDAMISAHFEEIEETIVSRHQEILCCNRQTIDEHNQKSKMKMNYHLVLLNLDNFPNDEVELRRINNFLESAVIAGVYVIAFGYEEMKESDNAGVQAILKHFKNINIRDNKFEITKEIFEFTELLTDHAFEALDLDKDALLQETLTGANLEAHMDSENIKLETDTRVK